MGIWLLANNLFRFSQKCIFKGWLVWTLLARDSIRTSLFSLRIWNMIHSYPEAESFDKIWGHKLMGIWLLANNLFRFSQKCIFRGWLVWTLLASFMYAPTLQFLHFRNWMDSLFDSASISLWTTTSPQVSMMESTSTVSFLTQEVFRPRREKTCRTSIAIHVWSMSIFTSVGSLAMRRRTRLEALLVMVL